MSWYFNREYVSVGEKLARGRREVQKLAKKGQVISPVVIEGKKVATTFWGVAWCEHQEKYSDFASRLPKGRAYVKNGSVLDLQIRESKVTSLVAGSELYRVTVDID